ncbi:YtpR family tRNA-binding protein [Enterococcus eurekensis]|uniref:YtpR family tRNA-binding protein n=1 Tax=Enterococcus eurekensis TaxID=1159753 RepID=A0ABV9M971_9ENTE
MIFAYNPKHVSDTLMVITADDKSMKQATERKGNIARLTTEDGRVIGWNFFDISNEMTIEGVGQVQLTDEQFAQLNELVQKAGFEDVLEKDNTPKFVVGLVKTCVPHEDSDHLSVTEIEVDNGEVLQIVCGAANIRKGLKVVVAKPGAMMPDGLLIWPGELRGVESFGMVCSAKELNLANAPMKRGILELPQDAVVGSAFAIGQ